VSLRIGNITFDCEEPIRVAAFWEAALGYKPFPVSDELQAEVQRLIDAGELDPTGWARLVPPDGVGPDLLFQRRPRTRPPRMPIHLDLNADDPDAEVERLVALGATAVETLTGPFDESCVVMRDPEGNGFCVQ
jgi:hypothetical protein